MIASSPVFFSRTTVSSGKISCSDAIAANVAGRTKPEKTERQELSDISKFTEYCNRKQCINANLCPLYYSKMHHIALIYATLRRPVAECSKTHYIRRIVWQGRLIRLVNQGTPSVGTGQKTVRNFPKSHSLFRHLDIGKKIPGYAATRVSPKGSVPVHTPPFGQALLHQGGQIGLGRVIPRRGHLHYWQLVSPLTASLVTVSVMMVTWWRCYQRTKYMWYTI